MPDNFFAALIPVFFPLASGTYSFLKGLQLQGAKNMWLLVAPAFDYIVVIKLRKLKRNRVEQKNEVQDSLLDQPFLGTKT